MTTAKINEPATTRMLRLWPGVAAGTLLVLFGYVAPLVEPEWTTLGLFGGLLCALVIFLWWLFFSRATWVERLAAIVLIVVSMFAGSRFIHVSIAKAAQGLLFPFMAIPGVALALVVSAVVGQRQTNGRRISLTIVLILLACGFWTLVRTGGFTGGFEQDLHWRWTPTPEELLLAAVGNEPTNRALSATIPSAVPAVETLAEWPGFRGPNRDGHIRGIRIETDWTKSPPVQVWRRPIGPGWSSFAVHGDRVYTQEQRGEEEIVACYDLTTGVPVWMHADTTRFWEPAGGAGPRATPAASKGRVFALGATGILNSLDAADGTVVWSRNAASDTGATQPDWGFAGSPLVFGDLVIVAASGKLAAYDFATGKVRWLGPKGMRGGYSSPHQLTIDGVPQILLMTGNGAISVAPEDGELLWQNESLTGPHIIQPAQVSDGDVLMSNGDDVMGGAGVRRVAITRGSDGWTAESRWTSGALNPGFNDLVVHKDHAYGFDGRILGCIDLADGQRKWKRGRYGNGQLVLLPEQDLLLVLSEDGRLALVSASPEKFTELGKFPALHGKTWNHPVLVGHLLLVRNAEEMAAFRLHPR